MIVLRGYPLMAWPGLGHDTLFHSRTMSNTTHLSVVWLRSFLGTLTVCQSLIAQNQVYNWTMTLYISAPILMLRCYHLCDTTTTDYLQRILMSGSLKLQG